MPEIQVTKRNGTLEKFNVDKIHKVLMWAVEDVSDVSVSDIAVHAELGLYDGITTDTIHQVLIKSASDLISEDFPNYQWVAARLLNYKLRKDVWGEKEPPRFLDYIKNMVALQYYTDEILKWYPEAEIHKLGGYIKHNRDAKFSYSGLQQLIDKYLIKNRHSGQIYETPQFAYMMIAMVLFSQDSDRLNKIKNAYDYFSTFKISLPTPIMCGVRTKIKQFASCVLIDVDDSLDSIFASVSAVGQYTAKRAGIGINIGRVRAINSSIRNGEVISTGVIPFLKVFESAVKSTSQNGIRGGSATVNIPFWHLEIEDVLKLKNNAGTDESRVRKLDYSIHFSKIFYERLMKNENITLFSPHECQDLYQAFGHPEFDDLYRQYELDSTKTKKVILARDLAHSFAKERLETGRIYAANTDHMNSAGSWSIDVKTSNLCNEVTHPLIPIRSLHDENGEIGICILGALNLLEIKNDEELEQACSIIVQLLNNLIDYQEYPVKAGENFAKKRRSLGVGITNVAAFLAKNKLYYEDAGSLTLLDEWMEKVQFFLLKESCNLAKQNGPCEKYSDTKYSQGLLPIDWANKNAQELVQRPLSMDWEWLREQIKLYGLRNSTLTAIMPCESSSVIQNSTNGIEPVRKLLSIKKAKNGTLKQIVPNYSRYKNYYTLAFSITDNECITKIAAILQKWVDMAISTNHYYNYSHHENGLIPISVLVKDLMISYKYGLKTLYYANSPDGDDDLAGGCNGGGCSV